MFMGMARPFRNGLGSARKFQSRSDPRFSNHFPGSFTLGTLSSPPASTRRTLTSGFSASRRATTDPDEPAPQMMKSYCDFIPDNSLDWLMRTRSAKPSDKMPSIKASMVPTLRV